MEGEERKEEEEVSGGLLSPKEGRDASGQKSRPLVRLSVLYARMRNCFVIGSVIPPPMDVPSCVGPTSANAFWQIGKAKGGRRKDSGDR